MGLECKLYADRERNSPNRDLREGKVPVDSKNGEPMPMIRIIQLKCTFQRRQIGGINRKAQRNLKEALENKRL